MPTSSPTPCSGTSCLTAADRDLIARARELAGLTGPGIVEHTRERDLGMAMASAFGECQHMLRELVGIAERLGGKVAAPGNFPQKRPRPFPRAGGVHCFRDALPVTAVWVKRD